MDCKDENGDTLLILAIRYSRRKAIKILLDNGADINATNQKGETALHRALIFFSKLEIVKILVERGANINVTDNSGKTPFENILQDKVMRPRARKYDNESMKIIEYLVGNGADINKKSSSKEYYKGYTALHFATREFDINLLKFLIRKGIDVNALNEDGNTPLIETISSVCLTPFFGQLFE